VRTDIEVKFTLGDKSSERLKKLSDKKKIPPFDFAQKIVEEYLDDKTTGPKVDPDRVSRKEALRIYDKELNTAQKAVVDALARYRLMTRDQVGKLIFGYDMKSATTRAGHYLSIIEKYGLVEVHEPDVSRADTTKRNFYGLTDTGMYVIEAQKGKRNITRVKQAVSKKILSPTFIDHHLELVECAIAFGTIRNNDLGKLIDWDGDGEVLYKFKHKGATHKIFPDGRGIWANDKTDYIFLVEMERKHTYTKDVEEKIKKYVYLFQSREYQRFEATYFFPVVLLVATDMKKLWVLRRATVLGTLKARETIPGVAPYVTFGLTLLKNLQDGSPFDPIWEAPLQGKTGMTFYDLVPKKAVQKNEKSQTSFLSESPA
jgi:hypothetical protein